MALPPSLWQRLVSTLSADAGFGEDEAVELGRELERVLEPAGTCFDGGLVGASAWIPAPEDSGDAVIVVALAGPAAAEPVSAVECSAPGLEHLCDPPNCLCEGGETALTFRAGVGAALVAFGFDSAGLAIVAVPAGAVDGGCTVMLPSGLAMAVVCEVQGGVPPSIEGGSPESAASALSTVWGGSVGVAVQRESKAPWLRGALDAVGAAAAAQHAGVDWLVDEEASHAVCGAFDAAAGSPNGPPLQANGEGAPSASGADGEVAAPAEAADLPDEPGSDAQGRAESDDWAAGGEEWHADGDGADSAAHPGESGGLQEHGELGAVASPAAGEGQEEEGAYFGEEAAGDWGDRHALTSAGDEQRLMEAEAAAEATAALEAERQDLEDRLAEAMSNHEALSEDNRALQRRALLFFLEKNEGAGRAAGGAAAAAAASSADKEERYDELLTELRSANQKLALAEESFSAKTGRLFDRFKSERERLDLVRTKLAEFQAEVCDKASHTVTGKGLAKSQAAQWEAEATTLREMVSGARQQFEVDSLRLSRLEQSARAREDVGGGLSTIDFEQLKIENATVHEKIEDRQDELRKLRSKMTTTVQVLTHVREKLQFVQAEADALHAKAAAVEAEVAAQRAALAGSKRQRENQRSLIDRRKTARGFAHSDRLAIDFETRKTEATAMKQELEDLKRRYAAMQRRTKLANTTLQRTRQDAAALGVADAVDLALG